MEKIRSDLGIELRSIRVGDSYVIDKDLTEAQLQLLVEEVFEDPVIHEAQVDKPVETLFDWLVEVGYRPGVTDNVARTAKEAIERTLEVPFGEAEGVYSRKLYFLRGAIDREEAETISRDILANDLIQTRAIYGPGDDRQEIRVPRVTWDKMDLPTSTNVDLNVSDEELLRISRDRLLALNLEEMRAIRDFFTTEDFLSKRQEAGLNAMITDCELEAIAQTWSEHCKHKIFNAVIKYQSEGQTLRIDSLFKTYIQASTEHIRADLGPRDYCLSVFEDNAGVIRFDDEWNLVFKAETHNSPSALDPYGGALTGIVGVNRDPFGTGLGSRLIFNTDVFCFAPPDFEGTLPPRLLHPRRVFEGVREGVEHGGNKSGIPTVNGAVVFHDRYLGKPLRLLRNLRDHAPGDQRETRS